jgi:hypothetical protein
MPSSRRHDRTLDVARRRPHPPNAPAHAFALYVARRPADSGNPNGTCTRLTRCRRRPATTEPPPPTSSIVKRSGTSEPSISLEPPLAREQEGATESRIRIPPQRHRILTVGQRGVPSPCHVPLRARGAALEVARPCCSVSAGRARPRSPVFCGAVKSASRAGLQQPMAFCSVRGCQDKLPSRRCGWGRSDFLRTSQPIGLA